MVHHLTIRVAWHDDRWNGRVCQKPSENAFCVQLERIRAERNDAAEDCLAGQHFGKLAVRDLPPCRAESATFMSPEPWRREFRHPYQEIPKASSTHGQLMPTTLDVPEYATYAVPFRWMLREMQEQIQEGLPDELPPDDEPPFPSPWVFGAPRQEALNKLFFERVQADRSLAFFYCKEGQPLGDTIPRLVVGVGRVLKVGKIGYYASRTKKTFPLWDRVIHHSIRPDGNDGFLVPYHDYLKPTGDPDEDARRLQLMAEMAVSVEAADMAAFSFAAEIASSDTALSTLVRLLESVRLVRGHGIASGPWEKREEWLNARLAETWKDRGAFPGLGSALEALGIRLGTALVYELTTSGVLQPEKDPWPLVAAILSGKQKPPRPEFKGDLEARRKDWTKLSTERRDLLQLLSRFDLTPGQAVRWFDPRRRGEAVSSAISDAQILENPYLVAEADLGDGDDYPVPLEVVDRGLLPDGTVAARFPLAKPSLLESNSDPRRIRAALVAVLRRAAQQGDSLLAETDALSRVEHLALTRPAVVSADWLSAHEDDLSSVIGLLDLPVGDGTGPRAALQLKTLQASEERVRKVLSARAGKPLKPLGADWQELLRECIEAAGGNVTPPNPERLKTVRAALAEQATALDRITTRKLGVLVGRAGTGKTSLVGALLRCKPLAAGGILLLAPTGKARVKLGKAAADADAQTVAQFLYGLGRYDGKRQRPLLHTLSPGSADEKHRKQKTVVIDECSMLTLEDLHAVLEALDLAHVERLILVGDPNQLPPIGVGRPFADLVVELERAGASKEPALAASALARLSVELRTTIAEEASDTLRLASWFTREPQPVDADSVLSDLGQPGKLNDLELRYWTTPEQLRTEILGAMATLGVKSAADVRGFNHLMGFNEKGWIPFDAPDGVERFQMLSPVRLHGHGTEDLNRWFQTGFRSKEVQAARENPWLTSLGDQEIVLHDKVMHVRNAWMDGWDGRKAEKTYIANGEIGTIALDQKGYLKAAFAGRPNLTISYHRKRFSSRRPILELAYAITVHKAQGSEFGSVFVVVPRHCRLLSRELLYTAITRSRQRLVLFIEGTDPSILWDLTRPERSDTARRNTNLFTPVLRGPGEEVPWVEHLVHRTRKGHMVRSKSELVIANELFNLGVAYEYERPLTGTVEPRTVRPDFSFIDPSGDVILWEHLGMLAVDEYKRSWERKRAWYQANGFRVDEELFVTADDERGGLDSMKIRSIAEAIRARL